MIKNFLVIKWVKPIGLRIVTKISKAGRATYLFWCDWLVEFLYKKYIKQRASTKHIPLINNLRAHRRSVCKGFRILWAQQEHYATLDRWYFLMWFFHILGCVIHHTFIPAELRNRSSSPCSLTWMRVHLLHEEKRAQIVIRSFISPHVALGAGRMTLCLNETRSPAKSPCLPPCQRPSSLSRHIPWDGTHRESELCWITPLSFPSKQNKVAVLESLGCGKCHCWMSFPTVNQTNTLRKLQPIWSVRSSISNIKHICF